MHFHQLLEGTYNQSNLLTVFQQNLLRLLFYSIFRAIFYPSLHHPYSNAYLRQLRTYQHSLLLRLVLLVYELHDLLKILVVVYPSQRLNCLF